MGETLQSKKKSSLLGILLQLPVFAVAAFGLCQLAQNFGYSFTDWNMLQEPNFVGLENYANIFANDAVMQCLGNTVLFVCVLTVLLMFTAILPALFTARLKLPFGLVIMGIFSIMSISPMLVGFASLTLSGDRYGVLNSLLMSTHITDSPILFLTNPTFIKPAVLLIFWLLCLAPVYSITYIAARMKRSFWGVAIAVCAIPVLMWIGGDTVVSVVGNPSTDYAADWLYSVYTDYGGVRYEWGFAQSVLFVGIGLFVGWCVMICSVVLGAWAIFRKVPSDNIVFKIFGLIAFFNSLLVFSAFSYFMVMYIGKAFASVEERFVFPARLPMKPTLQNFSQLADLLFDSTVPAYRYFLNSFFIVPLGTMPVCFGIALPSGVGFGLCKSRKWKGVVLASFFLFWFFAEYVVCARLGLVNTFSSYVFAFLASIELLVLVFLVYLTTRLVFGGQKPSGITITLGCLFLLSSFYAIPAIFGIWHKGTAIFLEDYKLLSAALQRIVIGGIARSGVAAAADVLMLGLSLAVLMIPMGLFLALYLSSRTNRKPVG